MRRGCQPHAARVAHEHVLHGPHHSAARPAHQALPAQVPVRLDARGWARRSGGRRAEGNSAHIAHFLSSQGYMSTPGVGVRVGDHLWQPVLGRVALQRGPSIHYTEWNSINRSQPNLGKRPGEGGSITVSSGYVEVSAEAQTHNTQTEHSCVSCLRVRHHLCVCVSLSCLWCFSRGRSRSSWEVCMNGGGDS